MKKAQVDEHAQDAAESLEGLGETVTTLEISTENELSTEKGEEQSLSTDDPEISNLDSAVSKVQSRIDWHNMQIDLKYEEINGHRRQIEALNQNLRQKFRGLLQLEPSSNGVKKKKNSKRKGGKQTTRDLVLKCLGANKGPVSISQIQSYLREHGRTTKPSVELNRMLSDELITRPSRGLYALGK